MCEVLRSATLLYAAACHGKDPGRLFDLLRPERFREYLVYEAQSAGVSKSGWIAGYVYTYIHIYIYI